MTNPTDPVPTRPDVEGLLRRADRDPYPPGDSRATYIGYGTVGALCRHILALEAAAKKDGKTIKRLSEQVSRYHQHQIEAELDD